MVTKSPSSISSELVIPSILYILYSLSYPINNPYKWYILITPDFGLNTGEMFKKIDNYEFKKVPIKLPYTSLAGVNISTPLTNSTLYIANNVLGNNSLVSESNFFIVTIG